MRILIIEDEYKIANAIKRGLEQQSYAVDVCYDGDEGLDEARSYNYDLIILDRMLPGMDGISILKNLRTDNIHIPILFLTAKDRIIDKAEGLNAGADDYLVKPFAFVELIARVRALLRRPRQTVDTKLKYLDLTLDTTNFTCSRQNTDIQLTAKEFALLDYLMRNPERILTKDMIIGQVWDYDSDILPNTVEVYIGYVRNKVDKPFSGPNLINTKRGFGYYFGVKE